MHRAKSLGSQNQFSLILGSQNQFKLLSFGFRNVLSGVQTSSSSSRPNNWLQQELMLCMWCMVYYLVLDRYEFAGYSRSFSFIQGLVREYHNEELVDELYEILCWNLSVVSSASVSMTILVPLANSSKQYVHCTVIFFACVSLRVLAGRNLHCHNYMSAHSPPVSRSRSSTGQLTSAPRTVTMNWLI